MKFSSLPLLSKLSRSKSDRGFTLLELMISAAISVAIISAALAAMNSQRQSFLSDRDRININDNMRLALSMMGNDIKQAGERLEQANDKLEFPVVQVIDGGGAIQPDRIIVQRKQIAEALTICSNINPGSTYIEVADAMTGANCGSTSTQPITALPNVSRWQSERCKQDSQEGCQTSVTASNCVQTGGSKTECLWGYLYDPVTRNGEFALIYGEQEAACASIAGRLCWRFNLVTSGVKPRQFNFNAIPGNAGTQPKLYVLEQREYRLSLDLNTPATTPTTNNDKVLELIVNDQDQRPQRLTNLMDNMQIRVRTGTGATAAWNTSFVPQVIPPSSNRTPDWQTISGIEVELKGLNPTENSRLSNNQLTLKSQFFPRNVQSSTQS
jgi:prepilin-type N-terminal cleavage/methylation domain-containing protein